MTVLCDVGLETVPGNVPHVWEITSKRAVHALRAIGARPGLVLDVRHVGSGTDRTYVIEAAKDDAPAPAAEPAEDDFVTDGVTGERITRREMNARLARAERRGRSA